MVSDAGPGERGLASLVAGEKKSIGTTARIFLKTTEVGRREGARERRERESWNGSKEMIKRSGRRAAVWLNRRRSKKPGERKPKSGRSKCGETME